MWKHRILYLAAAASAAVAYIVSDRREALVLFCFLIVLPLLTLCMWLGAIRSLHISCRLQENAVVGAEVPVWFDVERKHAFPIGVLLLDVEFENGLFGEKETVSIHLLPIQKRSLSFCYAYHAVDCGRIRLRASTVKCYDLLGIFAWNIHVYIDDELTVYPQELSLGVELLNRPETKSFGDFYAPNRVGQDVSEVSDLRDYVEGDSPKSIHWKMSGKLDRMIVREFGLPADYNTLILYNYARTGESMEDFHKRCNAVLTLTLSLSNGLLKHNLEHLVGTIVQGGIQFLPVQTLSSYEQMVGGVLGISVPKTDSQTDTLYAFLHANLQYGYTKVIYVTMDYDERAAKRLAENVHLTLVHVVCGQNLGYVSRDGYSMISVDADRYRETFRQIIL